MTKVRAVALSGGVGGAKLAVGLQRILAPGELLVVANTSDDFEHLGLSISPDIDTLLYTLSGRANPATGWGRDADSWTFMSALAEIGGPEWFRLGDKDLAIHVWRTDQLRRGASLSAVTRQLSLRFGIATLVMPMSDDRVRTRVRTDDGWLEFQDYFVRLQCEPSVRELSYWGAESARPAPEILPALDSRNLELICICPSNPYLSIDPILAVTDVRMALLKASAPVIAVSPLVDGRALKGPTAKIMGELGLPSTVEHIATHYKDIIDGLVVDEADRSSVAAIEAVGIRVHVTNTVMRSSADRCNLAHEVLRFADRMRGKLSNQ